MSLPNLKETAKQLDTKRTYLIIANIFLVFFLILLSNLHILPFRTGDFVFFSLITLGLALYRPSWVFLFFIGTIALENINLAPQGSGIMIRPYQFLGSLAIIAILIRLINKNLGFKLFKLAWYDFAVIILGLASFLSAFFATNRNLSLKQSIILFSFIFLYFLTRTYVQTIEDAKKIIPFFLSSSAIVMLYGIWQNVRFLRNLSNFEVMPGRPNASFTEADWYGIFLVLLLAILYSIIFYAHQQKNKKRPCLIWLIVIANYISLILAVSRSAWLGALAVTFIFLFSIFTDLKLNFRQWQWRKTIAIKLPIIASIILSIFIVYIFHLTNFQLFNRAQSTGSGLQKITVSCQDKVSLPEQIGTTDELEKFGCKHINLEEIASEQAAGKFVTETYRKDPNINIRSEIYRKSWELIKAHPILGIGWGSISAYLGTDERGAGLNASNIFLEVWLGSGIVGIVALVAILVASLINAIRNFIHTDEEIKIFGLFLILGFFALVIPNLFNSGILLGIFWVFLAVANIKHKN